MPAYALVDALDCLFHYALGDVGAAIAIGKDNDVFIELFDPALLLRCSYCFRLWAQQGVPTV